MNITIRTITVDDAESLLKLQHQLDAETKFMLLEPGERTTTLEKARENIQRVLDQPNGTILVAEHEWAISMPTAAERGAMRIRFTSSSASCRRTQDRDSAHAYSNNWKSGHVRRACIVWNLA